MAFCRRSTGNAYATLVTVEFVNGLGFPLPAEVCLVTLTAFVQQGSVAFWPALLLACGANVTGSLVPFSLARWGISSVVQRLLPQEAAKRERVEMWVRTYGSLSIAVTRVIGFFRMAVIVMAGSMSMSYGAFVVSLFLGAVVWSLVGMGVLTVAAGPTKRLLATIKDHRLESGLLLAIILVAVGSLTWRRRQHKA